MAVASSYAWPSVVVYRGAMVAKRRTIVNAIGVTTLVPYWRNLYVLCMMSHPFRQINCCTDSLAPIFGQTEEKKLIKLGRAYVQ